MNHYRNLTNYVDSLISYKAERTPEGLLISLDDLDDDEIGKMATLFLEYDDRDTTECFADHTSYAIDDDITCALLKMLKNDSAENRQEFANLVRKNTIRKYTPKMQEMLDERANEFYSWRKIA